MRIWKWMGLAGIAGMTATGAVIARAERRRRAYTPDQVRSRLHARIAEDTESGLQRSPTSPGDADA